MTERNSPDQVTRVKINSIHILNPRERRKANFQKVVDSIASVGLKRPIKVSRRELPEESLGKKYNLICGQGRLEALKSLGETHVPAFVVELSDEDCFLQSLIENLARRRHTAYELMTGIGTLIERGYSKREISRKTGLDRSYVKGICRLINDGEERLVSAVERNQIPISVAIEISTASHADAQAALQEAYERRELRGQKLQTAIRVINNRHNLGRRLRESGQVRARRRNSAASMVRAYKRETERQKVLIQRADLTENRLLIIKSVLEVLFADENFKTLLRAESLDTIPTQVADMLDSDSVVS